EDVIRSINSIRASTQKLRGCILQSGLPYFLRIIALFMHRSIILYPYADAGRFGYYAFRVIGTAATLISVYAAKIHRTLLVFALILAIPTLLQRILLPKADASSFSVFNIVLSFVFDLLIIVVIFRHVFAKEQANSETIFGALCIYLLVGFSFASAYGMVATFQPNAFYLDPRTNLHIVPDRFDFIYYSFGTMTSLGTAGITPVSPQARSVSVLEAILGVLYLAVLIARLMGAYRPNPSV
ncbi:MAG: ion channel, partial [Terriglobales bacterium]